MRKVLRPLVRLFLVIYGDLVRRRIYVRRRID